MSDLAPDSPDAEGRSSKQSAPPFSVGTPLTPPDEKQDRDQRLGIRKRPIQVTIVFKGGETHHPRSELRQGTTARDLFLIFWWPDFGIYLHDIAGMMDVRDRKIGSSIVGTADLTKGKDRSKKGKRAARDDGGVDERAVKKKRVNIGGSVDVEGGKGEAPAASWKPGSGLPLDLSLLKDDEDVFGWLDVMLRGWVRGPIRRWS